MSLHKSKTRMAQNNNSSEVGKRSGGSCRDVGTFSFPLQIFSVIALTGNSDWVLSVGNILVHGPNIAKKLYLCFQNLLNDLCSCAQKLELLNSVASRRGRELH